VSAWDLRIGDALEQLAEMEDRSVHCCITSPPFYGLRDYGTGEWEGGDPECDHVKGELRRGVNLAQSVHSTRGGAKKAAEVENVAYGRLCGKCGATRIDQQIGLESTPDGYVAKLVEVFREVKRVLRDDGTLWLNLGDSYAGSWGAQSRGAADNGTSTIDGAEKRAGSPLSGRQIMSAPKGSRIGTIREAGCKPKDLYGIPWMVAFALRADGWYLRRDIIWSKPNPMPESVIDRPTSAHEYVFLLSKSARYYYDAEAIREPASYAGPNGTICSPYGQGFAARTPEQETAPQDKQRGHSRRHAGFNERWDAMTKVEQAALGRNKRSVWEIATRPYPEAHFATYPAQLIEPMVLAGVPRQACGVCGAPWERMVEITYENPGGRTTNGPRSAERKHLGWRCTCEHEDGTEVGVVLDPFVGSGTTLEVAVRNGRSAIGIDLNPDSTRLVKQRVAGVTPSMFDAV
jgi:DNA modification methylase